MKPDWKDAPEWARYLCMDADGSWHWFELRPTMYQSYWDVNEWGRFATAIAPLQWDLTLEERPQ